MDAAQQAIDKLFGNDQKTTTSNDSILPGSEQGAAKTAVEQEVDNPALDSSALEDKTVTKEAQVNPAVEHETIKKEHETVEDVVIDKEKHQHHYQTTVQPLEDREVLPTQHEHEQVATEVREFDNDDAKAVPAQVEARNAEFEDQTVEGKTFETTTQTEKVANDEVQHHLHETIQPVIEKETVQPSVTHKTIPIKEIHHEQTKDHGVTVKPPMSVGEFQGNLNGEAPKEEVLQHGDPKLE